MLAPVGPQFGPGPCPTLALPCRLQCLSTQVIQVTHVPYTCTVHLFCVSIAYLSLPRAQLGCFMFNSASGARAACDRARHGARGPGPKHAS